MGILDMYGFERERPNHESSGDFEQLIINFANEKLQQVYFIYLYAASFWAIYIYISSSIDQLE